MNTYYTNSFYIKDNIQNKLDIGTDGIEIYLINPMLDSFWQNDYLNLITPEQLKTIKLFHMPISTSRLDGINVKNYFGIESKDGQFYLNRLLERIETIRSITKNEIGIVAHIENTDIKLKSTSIWNYNSIRTDSIASISAWDENVEYLQSIAIKYPCINIYITNNIFYDRPLTSYNFVKAVNLPNVKCCLNICHLQICEYMARQLRIKECPAFSLEQYLRITSDKIGIVHLSAAVPSSEGFGKGNGHCANFKDDRSLSIIYQTLQKYNIKVPYVINIKEKDYMNCINYQNQIEQCKRVEKTLNQKG